MSRSLLEALAFRDYLSPGSLPVCNFEAVRHAKPATLLGRRNGWRWGKGAGIALVQVRTWRKTMFGVAMLIEHAQPVIDGMVAWRGLPSFLHLIGIPRCAAATDAADGGDRMARRADTIRLACWQMGFLTTRFNPKTTLFVVSAPTRRWWMPHTAWAVQLATGCSASVAHRPAWFSLVAWFCVRAAARRDVAPAGA